MTEEANYESEQRDRRKQRQHERLSTLRSDFGISQRRPRQFSDPVLRRAIAAFETLALSPEVSEDALAPFFTIEPEVGQPWPAAIRMHSEIAAQMLSTQQTRFVPYLRDSANSFTRWRRQHIFHKRYEASKHAPVVVAEGDSWFHFPIFLRDVCLQLANDYLIWPLGQPAIRSRIWLMENYQGFLPNI